MTETPVGFFSRSEARVEHDLLSLRDERFKYCLSDVDSSVALVQILALKYSTGIDNREYQCHEEISDAHSY